MHNNIKAKGSSLVSQYTVSTERDLERLNQHKMPGCMAGEGELSSGKYPAGLTEQSLRKGINTAPDPAPLTV